LRNAFFFQAEDGIRDYKVTGVQTCALRSGVLHDERTHDPRALDGNAASLRIHDVDAVWVGQAKRIILRTQELLIHVRLADRRAKIGRASGRERDEVVAGGGASKEEGEG